MWRKFQHLNIKKSFFISISSFQKKKKKVNIKHLFLHSFLFTVVKTLSLDVTVNNIVSTLHLNLNYEDYETYFQCKTLIFFFFSQRSEKHIIKLSLCVFFRWQWRACSLYWMLQEGMFPRWKPGRLTLSWSGKFLPSPYSCCSHWHQWIPHQLPSRKWQKTSVWGSIQHRSAAGSGQTVHFGYCM